MASSRSLSQEKKRQIYWYILNNVNEMAEYRKKYLRLIRRQASSAVDLFKRHQRAFLDWFRVAACEFLHHGSSLHIPQRCLPVNLKHRRSLSSYIVISVPLFGPLSSIVVSHHVLPSLASLAMNASCRSPQCPSRVQLNHFLRELRKPPTRAGLARSNWKFRIVEFFQIKDNLDSTSTLSTMSQFSVSFDESYGLFDFNVNEFNTILGTSSVGDTSDASQPAAPTPKRRQHSKNLKLERYVA
ncbi:uncharacterized protein E5676_scaffold23G00260 [Cucumis melo var. makuwa]|uniref:CACTA en-spm transposon protein n=1 Tax=Cucumis melo var. makuwa TaxID=1194695 RepID=A0A5D3BF68_CUCMM|nr:uncharacterized protein E5676_scaffold23G00260 [Cucumis melo var. makuwa]